MSLIRLNKLVVSYRHQVFFGFFGKSLSYSGNCHYAVRGYAFTRAAPCTVQTSFLKKHATSACAFDSHFHTSFNTNDRIFMRYASSVPNAPGSNPPDNSPADSSVNSTSNGTCKPPQGIPQQTIEPKKPKKSVLVKMKEELVRYYHGFRLLGLETRIAGGICFRLLTGNSLTRRERNQLVRTVADIFRLVPFAVFIIVPFMEFLLPIYLKFFPFMLPSTFKEKGKEEEKVRQQLKAKLKMARFLQETVMQTTSTTSKSKDIPTIVEFQEFLKTVRQSGQLASTKDIVRFSRLFEDQVTLDSLDHAQLKALCRLLEINSIGPSNLLRFQLWLRVRQLRTEDKMIAKEGVDQIPSWELQSLSRSRGMRSIGLTKDRLRSQLSQWLELHLEKNVPIALLLLSRAMYLQDATLPPEQQLQHVIAGLPNSAAEEAAVKAVESTEDVDPETKIKFLRMEQETIKAERVAARKASAEEETRKAAEEETRKAAEAASPELLVDKAKPLEPKVPEELKDSAEKLVEKPLQKPLEPIVPPVKPVQTPLATPEASTVSEFLSVEKPSTVSTLPTQQIAKDEGEVMKPIEEEEPVVSSKDLDNIKDAIESMEESKKALQDEQLLDLKADLEETVKLRQQHQKDEAEKVKAAADAAKVKIKKVEKEGEIASEAIAEPLSPPPIPPPKEGVVVEMEERKDEQAKIATEKEPGEEEKEAEEKAKVATKKAAKTEKAAKRLGAHVDRLLGEVDGLMDKLHGQKENLLEEIQAQENKAKAIEKEADEEKRKSIFDNIRADQQRVVDINDVLTSLKQLQKAAGSEVETVQRWQRILDALDEDKDGKIEFKHLLAVLEMFEKEKVELNTSQLSDVVEMFEKVEETEEASKDTVEEAIAQDPETTKKAVGTDM